jgi:hypothetical protein
MATNKKHSLAIIGSQAAGIDVGSRLKTTEVSFGYKSWLIKKRNNYLKGNCSFTIDLLRAVILLVTNFFHPVNHFAV